MLGILKKISPSELVSNGYISNHNKVRRPRPKFKVSFFIYFCCFWFNVKTSKEKYKESFLIVVSSWNRDLMLMLERPLSHYWTSPLNCEHCLPVEPVSSMFCKTAYWKGNGNQQYVVEIWRHFPRAHSRTTRELVHTLLHCDAMPVLWLWRMRVYAQFAWTSTIATLRKYACAS